MGREREVVSGAAACSCKIHHPKGKLTKKCKKCKKAKVWKGQFKIKIHTMSPNAAAAIQAQADIPITGGAGGSPGSGRHESQHATAKYAMIWQHGREAGRWQVPVPASQGVEQKWKGGGGDGGSGGGD